LFLKSQPALGLASTSRYRHELLARLRVRFTAVAPHVDETALPDEAPLALATRLARAKAERVSRDEPHAWVIGSDQVAVLDQTIVGKPGTRARCIEQLQAASGRTLAFLTSVALSRRADGALVEFVDTTWVKFRTLDSETIARYVEAEEPLDCAGAFKSEGLGIALCDSIETADSSALIGLPLLRLAAALRSVGFHIP
jgi:septum formation protein